MWTVLCLPIYIISILGLLPDTSVLRGVFFERTLDASVPIFLMALTVKSPDLKVNRQGHELIFCIILVIFIITTSIFSIIRFGVDYFLVEYRQYILISFSLIFLKFTKRKFSVKKLIKFGGLYFFLLTAVFLINSFFGVQYRPGVFGESNYDLAILTIIVCSYLRLHKEKTTLGAFFVFSILSLSRTGMASFLIFLASRVKGIFHFIVFLVALSIILSLVTLRSETPITTIDITSLDRFIMAQSYLDEAGSNFEFLIFGQPLTNSRFQIDELSYYSEIQPVSAALGITTPSNFHGHLLRGFSLLGMSGYLLFLILLTSRIKRNFSKPEITFILALIFVSSISQSIFSHPLVGTILYTFLWTGFENTRAQRVEGLYEPPFSSKRTR